MSETETKTVRAKPLRDFNDAGTERQFTKDTEVDLTEGELVNYVAAGLVVEIATAPAEAVLDGDPTKVPGRRG